MRRNRKKVRLPKHDYSSKGSYFITLNTMDRHHYFGEIISGDMILSPVGQVVWDCWFQIPIHYQNVTLGAFIVMPDHVHAIIMIHENTPLNRTEADLSLEPIDRLSGFIERGTGIRKRRLNHFSKPVSGSVSMIINHLKGAVTRWCNRNNHRYFAWQRLFHDHVIRNDETYRRIEKYILENPKNWKE